jgi:hypothetical protein
MPEKDLAESLDTEDVHNAFGQCKQLLDRLHLLHLIKQERVYDMATTRHPNASLEKRHLAQFTDSGRHHVGCVLCHTSHLALR